MPKLASPHVVNIADLRAMARKRLPNAAFDYLDGAAESELTARDNIAAFSEVVFKPRQAVMTHPELATSVLGVDLALPFILSPIGYSRMLNPRFNMWKASEPVVGDWIRTNLGPKRIMTDLRDGLKAAVKLAEAAPEIAAKTEKFHHELLHMSENGLRFDPQTAEAIGRSEAKHSRSGRFALWIIALTLLYIAWHLG